MRYGAKSSGSCRASRTVTIVVRGGKVSVDIGPVCTEAATDAGDRGDGAMTHYTVCCGYASHYHNTVTVEADTLDAALEKAIEQAGDDPHWKSVRPLPVKHSSRPWPRVMDADPWGDTVLPVPDRFSEKGEPLVVTLTGLRPPGGIEVAGGTVRIRFVEHAGTVTTEDHRSTGPAGQQTSCYRSDAEPMALRMWP